MVTVTFIFIRHGESTDNTRTLWAGWRDSPLTNHGMNQAKALGEMLSPVEFKAIHCSDLKRAVMTAEAISDAQSHPKPPVQASALFREQNYGSGEGKRWDSQRISGLTVDEHYERGIYPALRNRSDKFPGGESLEDLADRAKEAIDKILLPYVWDEAHHEAHIVVVSHGLFLVELITALIKRQSARDNGMVQSKDFRGMRNTAWTKVRVSVEVSPLFGFTVLTLRTRKAISAQRELVN